MLSLWALFLSAFGAATLLPLQSEAVLVGLLLRQPEAWATLLLVATLGNVLGSVVNWLLGRAVEHLRDKRWFPFSAAQLERRSSVTSAGGSGRCCSAGCR